MLPMRSLPVFMARLSEAEVTKLCIERTPQKMVNNRVSSSTTAFFSPPLMAETRRSLCTAPVTEKASISPSRGTMVEEQMAETPCTTNISTPE